MKWSMSCNAALLTRFPKPKVYSAQIEERRLVYSYANYHDPSHPASQASKASTVTPYTAATGRRRSKSVHALFLETQHRAPPWLPHNGAPIQRLHQLRPRRQHLYRLCISHPHPRALMHFRPLALLPLHTDLVELVLCFGSLRAQLPLRPHLGDFAKVTGYGADNARFFPGFAAGGDLGRCFVELPAAFREDPGSTFGGLDEKDLSLVGGEGDNACDESFTLGAVTCG